MKAFNFLLAVLIAEVPNTAQIIMVIILKDNHHNTFFVTYRFSVNIQITNRCQPLAAVIGIALAVDPVQIIDIRPDSAGNWQSIRIISRFYFLCRHIDLCAPRKLAFLILILRHI